MDYNKQFKKGIHDIKNISLSAKEKEDILMHLNSYTNTHPVAVSESSTMFSWLYMSFKDYRSAYSLVFATMLIIIGGNISYAAEQSLPGDTLYPVKIHVNEKIKGALKFTPKAVVKWEEDKVVKRLDEVQTLVEKGKFDVFKRTQVEKEIEKNAVILTKQKNKNIDKNIDKKNDNYIDKSEEDNLDVDVDFKNKVESKLKKINQRVEDRLGDVVQKQQVDKLHEFINNKHKLK